MESSEGAQCGQSVTSLGVGYLAVNPFRGEGMFREEVLDARTAVYEGTFLRQVRFDRPLWVCVDGRSNRGMIREADGDGA